MPKTYGINIHLLSTYYQRHSEHFLHMSLSRITSKNTRLLEVHEHDQSYLQKRLSFIAIHTYKSDMCLEIKHHCLFLLERRSTL